MFSVIQFPGSLDDRDMRFAMKAALDQTAELVWHKEVELPPQTSAVLLPGGFSYGDYLRCGAMAQYSPVMAAVKRFAESRRAGARRVQRLSRCSANRACFPGPWCATRTTCTSSATSSTCASSTRGRPSRRARGPETCCAFRSSTARAPTYATPDVLAQLERDGPGPAALLRRRRAVGAHANPNGSVAEHRRHRQRARGNVFGLMPHPEHAVEPAIGTSMGSALLGSLADAVGGGAERGGRGERAAIPSSISPSRASTGSPTRSTPTSSRSWGARRPSPSSGSSR